MPFRFETRAQYQSFAEKLAHAAHEGTKKRKRMEIYERESLHNDMEREWTRFNKGALSQAVSTGRARFEMDLDFSHNKEWFPNKEDILTNLPDALAHLRTVDGCSVSVRKGSRANCWTLEFSAEGLLSLLIDDEEKERGDESENEEHVVEASGAC